MATNLELAKQELAKVGGFLSKEISNPRVKKLLLQLKKVNTELTNIINGVEEEFSFDSLDENVQQRPQKRIQESSQNFGVDLGGFDNFVNQEDPEGFDWRETMREANGGQSMNLGNFEKAGNANANTLGRLVDNT